MRERWCLLLLPTLLHPSAEISLNLGGKSNKLSTTLAQMMLGLDEKHPISTRGETAHYQVQGICLECHCHHPKLLVGFNRDVIKAFPYDKKMPQGCDESRQSRIPQHFTALHFQQQPCTSSLHSFATIDF